MPNCKEIRYTLHGKRYFAIGFRNVSGGYEVRNRFFKASLSPKDISLMDNGSFPVLDRYERVNCYLDRDEAGRRTLEALRKRYADKIVDCSSLYKGYKDLNEYLQNKFL